MGDFEVSVYILKEQSYKVILKFGNLKRTQYVTFHVAYFLPFIYMYMYVD